MDMLTAIFSHVCGQGSCLEAAGAALPVCQRCLGLYVGAAVTAVWVLAGRRWRWGLPCWSVFLVQTALLLTAMFSGLHLLGSGPAWKAACGLWTGHIMVAWLAGAGAVLWVRRRGSGLRAWRLGDKAQALVMAAGMALLAAGLERLMILGWWFWSLGVLVGAVGLLASAAGALAAVVGGAWRKLPPIPRPG